MGLFDRLKQGLSRSRELINAVLPIGARLDQASRAELEAALLASDLGVALTHRLLDSLRPEPGADLRQQLSVALQALATRLQPEAGRIYHEAPMAAPEVLLIVGVNGSGKTTTTGKLAAHWTGQGQKVLLAAADTFRAAAVEQLRIWAERAGAAFVAQAAEADPAAVAFDAIQKGIAGGYQRVIIDTAGRLQTKNNLMEELRKVHRVCGKAMPGAPHRVLLVLDGTSGQNMLSQARLFNDCVPLTGLAVTKLDGTSKAGAVLAVLEELKVPVALVGVGESAEDLQEFVASEFAAAMVDA